MRKKWWIENGPRYEVVLSSRIRLARNFAQGIFATPIPTKATFLFLSVSIYFSAADIIDHTP